MEIQKKKKDQALVATDQELVHYRRKLSESPSYALGQDWSKKHYDILDLNVVHV